MHASKLLLIMMIPTWILKSSEPFCQVYNKLLTDEILAEPQVRQLLKDQTFEVYPNITTVSEFCNYNDLYFFMLDFIPYKPNIYQLFI